MGSGAHLTGSREGDTNLGSVQALDDRDTCPFKVVIATWLANLS